jgi:hypothetical protein
VGRKAMAMNCRFTGGQRPLIASLVALGRVAEAREVAAAMLVLEPDFRVGPFMARYPLRDAARKAEYSARLEAASCGRARRRSRRAGP